MRLLISRTALSKALQGQRAMFGSAPASPASPSSPSRGGGKSQLQLLPSKGGGRRWQAPSHAQPSGPPPIPHEHPKFTRMMGDLHKGTGAVHLTDHKADHVRAAAQNGLITVHKNPAHYSVSHHAKLTARGKAYMAKRSADREAKNKKAQVGLFKGLRLVISLSKAIQMGLFGAGETQTVKVKSHRRRAKSGKVSTVVQHRAQRKKAAPQELDDDKAKRMHADRARRDESADKARQEWVDTEAARLLAQNKKHVDRGGSYELPESVARAQAEHEGKWRRFGHDFDVPAVKLDALKKHVARLNKKAKRLGLPDITLEINPEGVEHEAWVAQVPHQGGPHSPVKWLWQTFGSEAGANSGANRGAHLSSWMTHHVYVEGKAPQIKGYEFLAKLEHGEGGNTIKGLHPGVGEIPTAFLRADSKCEHCNQARRRKDTFLVLSEKTGKVKQIGRTCLKEYMGNIKDPEQLAQQQEWLSVLDFKGYADRGGDGDGDDFGGFGSAGSSDVPLRSMLRHVAQVMLDEGGYSKSGSDRPTKDLALVSLDKSGTISQPAAELAEKAWRWGRNELVPAQDAKPTPGYLWNLSVMFRQGYANQKQYGLAASIVTAYERAMSKKAEPEKTGPTRPSEYVGTVGDKVALDLTLKHIASYDNEHGGGRVLIMEDPQGNKIKAFHSGGISIKEDPYHLAEVGQTYKVKATIKDHNTYRDEKETRLNRVTFVGRTDGHRHEQHATVAGAAELRVLADAGVELHHGYHGAPLVAFQDRPFHVEHGRGRGALYWGRFDHENREVIAKLKAVSSKGWDKEHKAAAKLVTKLDKSLEAFNRRRRARVGKAQAVLDDGSWHHQRHESPHRALRIEHDDKPGEFHAVGGKVEGLPGRHLYHAEQGGNGTWQVKHTAPGRRPYGSADPDHGKTDVAEGLHSPASAMSAIMEHHGAWHGGGGDDVLKGREKLKKGRARTAEVRGKGKRKVRSLGLPQRGMAKGKLEEESEAVHALPPTKTVRYRHWKTGEERTGTVVGGGAKGVTAIDDATGEAHKVHHGHYVAHDVDEDGWDDDEGKHHAHDVDEDGKDADDDTEKTA